MLYKGAKLGLMCKKRENLFAAFHRVVFHGGIIALLCCGFLLQGCGYKTKPVYLGCKIDPPIKVQYMQADKKDLIEKI